MPERFFIEPTKKEKYLGIVEQAFDNWYQREYSVLPREFFDKTSQFSFLSYLKHILSEVDETGEFSLEKVRRSLQEKMGENYIERKLENALTLIGEDDWQALLIQHTCPVIVEGKFKS